MDLTFKMHLSTILLLLTFITGHLALTTLDDPLNHTVQAIDLTLGDSNDLLDFTHLFKSKSAGSVMADARVWNGQRAERGMFPSQVRLYTTYADNAVFNCGGSLVRPNWVLTAAHCVQDSRGYDLKSVLVILGVTYAYDKNRVERRVTRVFKHADYSSQLLTNDIALLKFDNVELNQFVNLAWPPPSNQRNDDIVGDQLVLSGFGKIDDQTRTDELFWGKMKVAPLEYCRRTYSNRADIICCDTRQMSSSCSGDSGGPLFWYNAEQDRHVQIGITSFGFESCTSGYPVGYTRVSGYLDWIQNVINNY